MILNTKVGQTLELNILRRTKNGLYLGYPRSSENKDLSSPNKDLKADKDFKAQSQQEESPSNLQAEVLLPNAYIPKKYEDGFVKGDKIEVFLYTDSLDRLVATTLKPKAHIGEIAFLKVVGHAKNGIFLDLGISKDIFMPTKFPNNYKVDSNVVVGIFKDMQNRLIAKKDISPLIKPCINKSILYAKVSFLVTNISDLGYQGIILKDQYSGMVFLNESVEKLQINKIYEVNVKNIRSDGKLDLAIFNDPNKILQKLRNLKSFSFSPELAKELSLSNKGLKKILSNFINSKKIIFKDGIYTTL